MRRFAVPIAAALAALALALGALAAGDRADTRAAEETEDCATCWGTPDNG